MPERDLTAQSARQRLYEIVRREAPFEEKAEAALELVRLYLGADNGHLTRIDTETDHWEAIASSDGREGPYPVGLELDLETTYCRRTIAGESPVALHDAPAQGWDDDPAFQAQQLHCYHGTTLRVNDQVYGTVCFVAEDPRREQFSDGETMFAELVTTLLGRELERDQYEEHLAKQTSLVNVLNRVLRHNLRNDISVVRGRIQLMADDLADDRHADIALRNIDSLLTLAGKARQLEHIVGDTTEKRPTDIGVLIEDVVADVRRDVPGATMTVDISEAVTAPVMPSFERAVRELVENAAIHGGESPNVGVTVERVPNAVEVRVADDGPGLPDHECEVIATGTETPLMHGSGLGLWLAYWIVTSHGGTIETATGEENEGTTVTVSVPRSGEVPDVDEPAEIKRARDRYEAAFADAFDAMLILNDAGRIVDANGAAGDVFGLDDQELLGWSIREFLPEEFDFEATWEEIQHSETDRDTVRVVTAGGEVRHVEYAATTDIVPGQHLLIVRDVSDAGTRPQASQPLQ